ncbi:DUF998 domain-containing protein [Pseudarthrobacter sp. N5]|uniref:DUF998 domain-containing protein n=1 Tax=Pseudarthrobacter sp. N5 TaxID=3418416 RepID=UPI003CF20490
MTAAAATSPAPSAYGGFLPDLASTRQYLGAWAKLSVVQYFVAEAAVISAWGGRQPYDRRSGFISDLGAVSCGSYQDRDVCSPLHLLMNASFVVQGLGMLLGAVLLSSALLCIAAQTGARVPAGAGHRLPRIGAVAARVLTGVAGAGTMIVGLVPEDLRSAWHFAGALMFFIGGSVALLLLGWLWLKRTPVGWFVLACGGVSFAALVTGGLTGMQVADPGTLERLMGYPITIGLATVGLVIAQRVRQERQARKAAGT